MISGDNNGPFQPFTPLETAIEDSQNGEKSEKVTRKKRGSRKTGVQSAGAVMPSAPAPTVVTTRKPRKAKVRGEKKAATAKIDINTMVKAMIGLKEGDAERLTQIIAILQQASAAEKHRLIHAIKSIFL